MFNRTFAPVLNNYVAPAASPGTPPNTLFGVDLVSWWKADAASPFNDQKSGGTQHLASYGSPAVTVDATGINSHPAYKFQGGSGGLSVGGAWGAIDYPVLGAKCVIMCVVKVGTAVGAIFAMGQGGSSFDNVASWTGYLTSTNCWRVFSHNEGTSTNNTFTAGTVVLYFICDSPSGVSYWINNAITDAFVPSVALDLGSFVGGSSFMIGNNSDANYGITGWIGEMFVLKRIPTSSEYLESYNYLKTRFGL